jgi:hypothetical protein
MPYFGFSSSDFDECRCFLVEHLLFLCGGGDGGPSESLEEEVKLIAGLGERLRCAILVVEVRER